MRYSLITLTFFLALVLAIPTQASGYKRYKSWSSHHGWGHHFSFYGSYTKHYIQSHRSHYTLHKKTVYSNEAETTSDLTLQALQTKGGGHRSGDDAENTDNKGWAYVLDRSGYCYFIHYKHDVQIRSQVNTEYCR